MLVFHKEALNIEQKAKFGKKKVALNKSDSHSR